MSSSLNHAVKRIDFLDYFRGGAILLVLIFHYFNQMQKHPALAAIPLLGRISSFGWSGVSLFFVLSGFLIAMVLASLRDTESRFKCFWCRRAFRILPLYLLVYATYFLVRLVLHRNAVEVQADRAGIPDWTYLLFVQNFYMVTAGGLGNSWLCVTWSLAVEMQFYLFISVFFFLIPRRQLFYWSLGMIALAIAFRYFSFFLVPQPGMAWEVLFPSRLDAFFMGCILYGLVSTKPALIHRKSFLFVVAGVAVASFGLAGGLLPLAWNDSSYAAPLRDTWWNLGYTALLALGLGWPFDTSVFRLPLRFLAFTGDVSYFIYLFHIPVAMVLFQLTLREPPNLLDDRAILVMAAAAALVYGLAAFSYKYIEHPLIRISHRLYKPSPERQKLGLAETSQVK